MTDDLSYFDTAADRRMNCVLLAIVVVQLAFVLGIAAMVGGGIAVLLILFALVVAGNFANVYLFTFMMWKPLEKRWPKQPLLSGAVSRSFQTFWFNPIARLNMCLHATVDERHVHVSPMAPMRWLGASVISLPLDEMTDLKSTIVPTLAQVRIKGRRLVGPRWCLELVQPHENSP